MPTGEPGSPDVRANTMSCVAWCSPELNRFVPLITHSSPSAHGGRLEVRGVGAVVRLGEPEREPAGAVEEARHPLGALLVGAEVAHHQHGREVADDRALVLQVVVQPEALGREVLADDRHLEVGRRRGRRTPRAARSAASRPRRRAGASRASSSSQSWRGTPPSSKSVRAYSRRWSKNRMLSSGLLQRPDLALDERRRARRASTGSRAGSRSPRSPCPRIWVVQVPERYPSDPNRWGKGKTVLSTRRLTWWMNVQC